MAEISKQDIIINDLNLVETQISILKNNIKSLASRNSDLEHLIEEMKKENTSLSQRIVNLQEEINNIRKENETSVLNTLNLKEREELKVKLQNLISRIDYHLSS